MCDLTLQSMRCAGVIREEKKSGTTRNGRTELGTLLVFLRAGDVLMVTRVDRLARSIGDLQDIVRALKAKGAALKATEQPIDTSTAAGKCFLDMRCYREAVAAMLRWRIPPWRYAAGPAWSEARRGAAHRSRPRPCRSLLAVAMKWIREKSFRSCSDSCRVPAAPGWAAMCQKRPLAVSRAAG